TISQCGKASMPQWIISLSQIRPSIAIEGLFTCWGPGCTGSFDWRHLGSMTARCLSCEGGAVLAGGEILTSQKRQPASERHRVTSERVKTQKPDYFTSKTAFRTRPV